MNDGVDVHQRFIPINRIKDAPVGHGILVKARQIVQYLVAKILNVACNPLRLFQEPLGHRDSGLS